MGRSRVKTGSPAHILEEQVISFHDKVGSPTAHHEEYQGASFRHKKVYIVV